MKLSKKIITSLGLLAISLSVYADGAEQAMTEASRSLKTAGGSAITLFTVVCGFGALAGGCMLFYKMANGDNDASKKIGQWVGALVIATVVSAVVKSVFF
jgi:hypothetical protein